MQAVLLAQDIRDRERGGRAEISEVDGGHEKDSPELMKLMTATLGPKPNQLKKAVSDDTDEESQAGSVKLYQ